jgi:dienelactone hydrolase
MNTIKNLLLSDKHGKPIATDIFYEADAGRRPVLIYAHGFNGFKDWGAFDLIAKQFCTAGFTFVKFNFSHNGTTPDTPEDFTDLQAYAENNYSIELDNLAAVIDWVASPDNPYATAIDARSIGLLGHSLGGGITILKAAEDSRVKAIATWAAVSECKTPWGKWPTAKIARWKADGVAYVENGRTKQQMTMKYQLYEDYQNNMARLDIKAAISSLQIPVLLVHGTSDPSVPIAKAHLLKQWLPNSEIFTVESDHVFGRKHPWTEENLPVVMQEVVDKTIGFFSLRLKG